MNYGTDDNQISCDHDVSNRLGKKCRTFQTMGLFFTMKDTFAKFQIYCWLFWMKLTFTQKQNPRFDILLAQVILQITTAQAHKEAPEKCIMFILQNMCA